MTDTNEMLLRLAKVTYALTWAGATEPRGELSALITELEETQRKDKTDRALTELAELDAPLIASDTPLDELIKRSIEQVEAMSPEDRKAMEQAQRESWARGMQPCEHGKVDYEQCPACRSAAKAPPPETAPEPVAWAVRYEGRWIRLSLSETRHEAEHCADHLGGLKRGTVVPLFTAPPPFPSGEPTAEQTEKACALMSDDYGPQVHYVARDWLRSWRQAMETDHD